MEIFFIFMEKIKNPESTKRVVYMLLNFFHGIRVLEETSKFV